MKDKLANLQKKINIKFKNLNNLKKSLTHKSYDSLNNYEKLEFLGDRILGFVISKKIIELFPDEKEGVLDKKLASLVNKNKCLEVAKTIDLEKIILVGNKDPKAKVENKIIADSIEALIGAIYYDKGFEISEKFILSMWKNFINLSKETLIDSKTKLQEYSLKKFKSLPIYKLVSRSGPKHKPKFTISVRLKDSKFYDGKGDSKKKAEQNAAKNLLDNCKL
jgi:ribonuclease-3|tara:strand:- start:2041 stop:2703 length:663 start_codon:yes stop_codon:yes gene_type:complete